VKEKALDERRIGNSPLDSDHDIFENQRNSHHRGNLRDADVVDQIAGFIAGGKGGAGSDGERAQKVYGAGKRMMEGEEQMKIVVGADNVRVPNGF